jgi:hypothetical protein
MRRRICGENALKNFKAASKDRKERKIRAKSRKPPQGEKPKKRI